MLQRAKRQQGPVSICLAFHGPVWASALPSSRRRRLRFIFYSLQEEDARNRQREYNINQLSPSLPKRRMYSFVVAAPTLASAPSSFVCVCLCVARDAPAHSCSSVYSSSCSSGAPGLLSALSLCVLDLSRRSLSLSLFKWTSSSMSRPQLSLAVHRAARLPIRIIDCPARCPRMTGP